METYTTAYIGLGSNLDQPHVHITNALDELTKLPGSQNLHCSCWYQTKAIGPGEQPDYINAAVSLDTTLGAIDLLQQLQAIENQHGRQREIRWGARTLDLDLLLFGNTEINSPELQLPHPEIMNRNFVLYPLHDLNPSLILPNGRVLSDTIATVSQQDLRAISREDNPL